VQLDETTLKVTIKTVVNEAIDEHPTIQRIGSEIGELKSDVAELKIQTRTNTQAINQLFIKQQRQGVMMEDMRSDIKKVLEIVMPSKMREEQYDRMERRVENHGQRIGALEVKIRDRVGGHERS